MAVVDSYEDDGDLLAVFPEKGMDNSAWVIDSGCSFHMCGDKKYFSSYQACDGNIIKMANNTMSKVVGMGMVQLHFSNGRVMALTGLWHVPDLRTNIISLGTLDFND